jgi:hypothetical protein
METKRKIYIFAFTVLGLMIGFLIHALTEVVYIKLLLKDFVTYSFGLTWSELIQFHYVLSLIIIVVCGLWGWAAGRFWWRQIYVLKKYNGRRLAGLWRW